MAWNEAALRKRHRPWTKDDDCIPEPTVENGILEYIRAMQCSVTLHDLRAIGNSRENINRALTRLVRKGVLTRMKVPNPTPIRRGWQAMVFLYTLTEDME